jgi:hypothetical protein
MHDRESLRDTMKFPAWADDRYKRLAELDRYLDGKQYKDLKYPFSKETDGSRYVLMQDRRPNVTFSIAGLVGRRCGRKLFTGTHAPRIRHPKEKIRAAIQRLAEEAELLPTMCDVVRAGSVGSACIIFKVAGEGTRGRLVVERIDTKNCYPRFDKFGELAVLRHAYVAEGYKFLAEGFDTDWENKKINPSLQYFYIEEYDSQKQTIFKPVPDDKLIGGEKGEGGPGGSLFEEMFKVVEEEVPHDFGFVPAHWFVNMKGGIKPDGRCTWDDAINSSIALDYSLSNLIRGLNYNSNPQLVTQGELLGEESEDGDAESAALNPTTTLRFKSQEKESDGSLTGGGDAHLLEMTGQGIAVGKDVCDMVKKQAFEQIGASEKDPEKVGSLVTGKAMELLDSQIMDLQGELRTAYGDHGYLRVLKKLATAAGKANHPLMSGIDQTDIDGIALDWPRPFPLTPNEVFNLSQAMATACDKTKGGFMEVADAKLYFEAQIDLAVESADRNLDAEAAAAPAPDEESDNALPDGTGVGIVPSEEEQ